MLTYVIHNMTASLCVATAGFVGCADADCCDILQDRSDVSKVLRLKEALLFYVILELNSKGLLDCIFR